jgi:hypothetical protein
MDYRWNLRYLQINKAACITLLLLITSIATSGQSLTTRLEFEVINSKEFGRVLSVRTIIKNETANNIFLANFVFALGVERLNEYNQYENYFENWFIQQKFDSTRKVLNNQGLIVNEDHNGSYDKTFFKELYVLNQNAKDTTHLHKWSGIQVERIETIKACSDLEFQSNINSLPSGKYRFRYSYTSAERGVAITPIEKFREFKIPNRLLDFVRWTGKIDSGYLYLTIK